MKKINSNSYGGRILIIAIVFLLIIPVIMRLSYIVCPLSILVICRKISFCIGVLVAAVFIGMLGIEFHQDRYMEEYYKVHKQEKISIGNGNYECQNCGNRNVKQEDKQCSVCETVFDGHKDKHSRYEKKKYH